MISHDVPGQDESPADKLPGGLRQGGKRHPCRIGTRGTTVNGRGGTPPPWRSLPAHSRTGWTGRGVSPFLRSIVPSFPTATTASSISIDRRSEEHTSELQSLMRISYAVFCLENNIII